MTTVTIFRTVTQAFAGFAMEGHTGYSEAGTDIVCSAVSTVAFTCANGVTDVLGIPANVASEEGTFSCMLPASLSHDERFGVNVLFESMLLTLHDLERQYKGYIVIQELEV